MEAIVFDKANAMPAPTWHRMKTSSTTIEIPAGLDEACAVSVAATDGAFGEPDAFEAAIAQAQAAWEETHTEPYLTTARVDEAKKDDDGLYGGTALSRYQAASDAVGESRSLAVAFETGISTEVYSFMREYADEPVVITASAGKSVQATLDVTGVDGAMNFAAVDVVAGAGSDVTLILNVDSPDGGTGVVGTSVRAFADSDASIRIVRTQTLDDGWIDLDDMGLFTWDDAKIDVRQTILGASNTFTGIGGDIRGNRSRMGIEARYLGHGEQVHDINYTLRHNGVKTQCNINSNGVLAGKSKKTMRGTIDFVRGCKGAEGTEHETVLLVDDDVENKSVPVILCNEDDVAGNHGAAIGHVRPEQMFYLASRGLSQEAAEQMFVRAMLEQAAIDAPDQASREGVLRLAITLVDGFDADFLEEEA